MKKEKEKIIVSKDFLESYLDDMDKLGTQIVDCLKAEFIKDIPKMKKYWLSACELCDKSKADCPLCTITKLIAHLESIVAGDDYE